MSRFERANLAQLVEHHLAKVDVEGSSPLVRSILYGGVAQLVEQVTLNHWVHGSSPCTPTIPRMGRAKRYQEANLAQLVEHHLAKVDVEGSSPLVRSTLINGGVAQLVEQVTLNHWVHGSSPCTPTILEA